MEHLGEIAQNALVASGVVSTTVIVSSGLAFPYADIAAVTKSANEAAIVLLPPDAQTMYLGELVREQYQGTVLGFPWPQLQTRQAYLRLSQDSAQVLATPRVAGWDASLVDNGAADLNLRYASRSARVMDVTAWSTYAAVELAIQAGVDMQSNESSAVSSIRVAPAQASLYKGSGLSFDAARNQLQQPLYLVLVSQEARWSAAVSERIGLAEVVSTLPERMQDLPLPSSVVCD